MLLFRLCLIFVLLLPAGCGFSPLYATGPNNSVSMSPLFADIEIRNIPNRNGQMLRNYLIDRLYTQGRPQSARYELRIANLKEANFKLGIKKDASATRAQMRVSAEFSLVDRYDGTAVLTRELRSLNSYNVLDSQFTTMVTEDDARDRALRDISDQIVTQLALYFKREEG